jgi:hypothetical protein
VENLPESASYSSFRSDEPQATLRAMQNHASHKHDEIKIRDLYPDLDEQQLKDAEENLRSYIEIALRIYERIKATNGSVNNSSLTPSIVDHRIDHEKVEPTNH